jgi:molybdenum cofactor cytidylyltransferase
MISAVVLAAGPPVEDLLTPVDDKPVLQWVLECALASHLDEIICVTRDLTAVRRAIRLGDRRLYWMVSPAANGGQSGSLIAGLWASHPESAGVMFLAGDQKPVDRQLIDALIARFEQSSAWIVAATADGDPGSPAIFRRELFPELLKLKGNENERTLLSNYADEIALLERPEEILSRSASAKRGRARVKQSI